MKELSEFIGFPIEFHVEKSLRTFCLATETGTHSAHCAVGVRDAAVYGGVHGEGEGGVGGIGLAAFP